METWLNLILGTIVALLPITNPISTAAFFLSITSDDTPEYRKKQALMGVIYMVLILLAFLVAGSLIMNFFGISIPGLKLAGGVMVIRVAMGMLETNTGSKKVSTEAASKKEDISFTPLAMPSLSGPGSIAVTIGLAADTQNWINYTAIVVDIIIVAIIAYVTLRTSTKITAYLGKTGMMALSKIMGFLLLCVGIQFVINATVTIINESILHIAPIY